MKTVCKKCGGRGVTEKDGKLYECLCELMRRIALSMPGEIRKTPVTDQHVTHPLVDRIKENCHIVAAWTDMRAIIKVMLIKYHSKNIRVTTDAEIKNVFVGGMQKDSHSEDYVGEIYNNIQDFMDPPDLMIVRLGVLNTKNVAAAGALEEAILHRIDKLKPIWVLSDMDNPFTLGSRAYSAALEDLFRLAFSPVQVHRITAKPRAAATSMGSMDATTSASASADPIAPEPYVEPRMPGSNPEPERRGPKAVFGRNEDFSKPKTHRIQSVPDDDLPDTGDTELNTIGSGVSKGKKFQRKS